MLEWVFLLLNLSFALFLLYYIIAFISGAPFVPSTKNTAATMIHLAHLRPGMKIYDLGSGDGRLLFLAANLGAVAVGFEINPFLVVFTHIKRFLYPKRNQVKVYWKNFWQVTLSDADVVFVYLLPWRMKRLQQFLETQLKPGAIVVSNSFIFSQWKIVRKNEQNHVYVFRR